MKKAVDRRALLAGAAVAALSMPAAVHAGAIAAEDPVIPLFRMWVEARADWYQYVDADWDAPDASAAADREMSAFRRLLDVEPTTMVGVAALVLVLWDFDGPSYRRGSQEYLDELDEPANKLKAAIWRGASQQTGLPPGGNMDGALDFLGAQGAYHGV